MTVSGRSISHLDDRLIDAALAESSYDCDEDTLISVLESFQLFSITSSVNLRAVKPLSKSSFVTKPLKLKYASKAVEKYLSRWCLKGNDCPKGQYQPPEGTDCTHFVAHAANVGGVGYKNFSATCPKGIPIRVVDFAASFANATKEFSNVHQLASWRDAKKGDYCFVVGWFGQKNHTMVLNARPNPAGAAVYGHDTNRCRTFATFDVDDCKYYRIEDA